MTQNGAQQDMERQDTGQQDTGKVWFITGASRGFGRIWAEAALARGDRVAVTARRLEDVQDFAERHPDTALPLALDVTDEAQVRRAVQGAHAHFGRLDVVLNNAGYTLAGTVEEVSEADAQALFNTNLFGAHRVIRAALPLLRAQGHGHIIGVSSSLSLVGLPVVGFYCATKWAFEALHESLAKEVAGFGLNVTLLEPGSYATDFASAASIKVAPGLDAYAGLRSRVFAQLTGAEAGDPQATPQAVFAVVDAPEPPLRLFLGSQSLPQARAVYAERLATWDAWAEVSNAAQGAPTKKDASGL